MRKLSHEEFCQRVKEVHGDEYDVLGRYVNRRTKITVRHNKCGTIWDVSPWPFTKGHGCPKCFGVNKKTTEMYKEEVKSLVGDEYSVLGEYKNTHAKIRFIHNECGHVFDMVAKAFLLGQRCPKCRLKKMSQRFRKTTEQFKKEVYEKVGDEYIVLSDYKGKDVNVKMLHRKCGNTFEVTPNHFLSSMNSRCPHCKTSKGEEVIRKFLLENGYTFKSQYRIKECRNIRPLPFDFAIFNGNTLVCLIEFDGEQHFHPKFGRKEFERTIANDKIKNEFCAKNNIPLIRIPYISTDIKADLAKALQSMKIPSQACPETAGRCND